MKVAVSAHGRFHAFDLAGQLHKRGLLSQLTTTYPKFAVRKFLPADVPLKTAPRLEAIRRIHDKLGIGDPTDLRVAKAFGGFAAKTLPQDLDLLIGWSGASLEAIRAAKARGIKTVLERGSSHIAHQTRVLEEEYGHFDIHHEPTELGLIERELEEYSQADAIAVPSHFAARTFVKNGIPADKLLINPYGVDLARFGSVVKQSHDRPRIVFVGRVGLRKGIPWLLKAFASIAHLADLHLIGPLEDGMEAVLADHPTTSVVVRGALPGDQLAAEYAQADVFCLPSLEEGLALVVLQAMAAGLPIVATPETGTENVVETEKEGLIVPSRDISALEEALETLITDRDKSTAMGEAARKKVASGFTWDDYGDRAVKAYETLLKTAE